MLVQLLAKEIDLAKSLRDFTSTAQIDVGRRGTQASFQFIEEVTFNYQMQGISLAVYFGRNFNSNFMFVVVFHIKETVCQLFEVSSSRSLSVSGSFRAGFNLSAVTSMNTRSRPGLRADN